MFDSGENRKDNEHCSTLDVLLTVFRSLIHHNPTLLPENLISLHIAGNGYSLKKKPTIFIAKS